MCKLEIHERISYLRTDKKYRELHKWIDQPRKELGTEHRIKRHVYNSEARKYVFDNFGGIEAVLEWQLHIALDALDTYRKIQFNNGIDYLDYMKITFGKKKLLNVQEFIDSDKRNKEKEKKAMEFVSPDQKKRSPINQKKKLSYVAKIEKIKNKYPNAYTGWTAAEDKELLSLVNMDCSTGQIAKILKRQPSAIKSRKKKLEENRIN